VFLSTAGTPVNPRSFDRLWKRTLRRAEVRDLPFHSTRHSAVSMMVQREGLNPKQLQTIVGHASIVLTLDLYAHLFEDSFAGFGSGLDSALRDTARDTAESGADVVELGQARNRMAEAI
jgi:site-specific recombinase XerC